MVTDIMMKCKVKKSTKITVVIACHSEEKSKKIIHNLQHSYITQWQTHPILLKLQTCIMLKKFT